MAPTGVGSGDESSLRSLAEQELRKRQSEDLAMDVDARKLLHELQVHQIELEMQNEALREAQLELTQHRDHLEQLVTDRTEELQSANRDLQGFIYAASHDLRGPLGRINNFSALLGQRYGERLDGDALMMLDFIHQNATRLTQLVDDLLSHALVTQHSFKMLTLEVAPLVQAALRDKAVDIQKAKAEVRVDVKPAKVLGDAHTLNQVLGNLLENALKYSSSVTKPVIEVGGKLEGDRYQLWVRDNGIGFDMAYHDKIFEILKRLHTYNEYQGSGIGLALVKRAMERVGGRVWAESSPGEGATFFLELQIAS